MQPLKVILLSFSCLVFFLVVGSCQEEQHVSDKDALLEQIAGSSLYQELLEVRYEKMYFLSIRAFDLHAIGDVFQEHPTLTGICYFEKQWFEPVKGGELYYDLSCRYEQLLDQLDEQFGYRDLSVDEMSRTEELYKLKTGGTEEERFRKRAFESHFNRN